MSDKALIQRIYKQLLKIDKKKTVPIENEQKPTVHKREYLDYHWPYEKLFNIINHQVNTNKSHNMIVLTYQRQKGPSVGENIE